MSDMSVLGVGGALFLGVVALVVLLSLLFGALCLHIAAGLLRLDRKGFGQAFKAHALLVVFAVVLAGVGHFTTEIMPVSKQVAGPLAIGMLLSLILVPILIVKSTYRCSSFGALVACVLSSVVESAIGVLVGIGLILAAVAAGLVTQGG